MFVYAATIISMLLRVNVLFVLLPFSSCACSPPYEETALLKRLTSFFTSSRNQSVSNCFLLFRAFRGGGTSWKGLCLPFSSAYSRYALASKKWQMLLKITNVAARNDLCSLQNWIIGNPTAT